MQKLEDLLNTGVFETFSPEKKMTVADLLKELNLEDKYFGILVDGKKATPDTVIDQNSKIVILPHIAGGM
ncbi:MAG: MoaD/ThiS family protein [Promethearchaeota archaeon]